MCDTLESVKEVRDTVWNPVDPFALRRLEWSGKQAKNMPH